MMGLDHLFHPLVLFVLSTLTVTLTAGFTNRRSPIRYVALLVLVAIACIFPFGLGHFVKTMEWIGRVPAGAAFWNIIICFDRLLLRRWDYDHYGLELKDTHEINGHPKGEGADASRQSTRFSGTRMDFGSEVSGSARGIAQFWQVKNVPYFNENDPEYIPQRRIYVIAPAITQVSCYFAHNITVDSTLDLVPGVYHSSLVCRISQCRR